LTGDLPLTSDQIKRRRTLQEISHIFLSCQGDRDKIHESTDQAPNSIDGPTPYRSTTTEPDCNDKEILPSISRPETGDREAKEPQAPRPDPIHCLTGHDMRPEPGGSVEVVLRPQLYPVVTLIWKEASSQDRSFEASIPLCKEAWLDLAKTWKEWAAQIDACASWESMSAWNSAADLIMSEVRAEERRERNREAYEAFGDFVASVSNRTGLDNIRQAQMIHDKASELELH
jgi:hypothetical protein